MLNGDEMRKILWLAIFVCCAAKASDWHAIAFYPEQSLQVDLDSISSVSRYKKVWTKIAYRTERQVEMHPDKKYVASVGLWYYDCKNRTMVEVTSYSYAQNGEIANGSSSSFRPDRLQEIVPDSYGDKVASIICAANPRSAFRRSQELLGLPPTADIVKDWKDIPAPGK